MKYIRYLAGPIVGISVVVFLSSIVIGFLPIGFVSSSSFATAYAIAAIAGATVAIVVPDKKTLVATSTGVLISAALVGAVVFLDRYSHLDPMSLQVAWAFGLIPSFFLGGALVSRLQVAT